MWSQPGSGGCGGTSTPSTKSDHNSTSYGSLERNKHNDFGWGEVSYNDSSADSSGYGPEQSSGFVDTLLSSTPEVNNTGWSRNLTREFEQESGKISSGGPAHLFGNGSYKRSEEHDHIYGCIPSGTQDYTMLDSIDSNQKYGGFEGGVRTMKHYIIEIDINTII